MGKRIRQLWVVSEQATTKRALYNSERDAIRHWEDFWIICVRFLR